MQIRGGSVKNTLDLAVFGDILVWVLTLFGLVPMPWLAKAWEKLFGRKKDFQEQLAELNDDTDDGGFMGTWTSSVDSGPDPHIDDDIEDAAARTVEPERVHGQWGVVPKKYPSGDDAADAIMHAYLKGQCAGYS